MTRVYIYKHIYKSNEENLKEPLNIIQILYITKIDKTKQHINRNLDISKYIFIRTFSFVKYINNFAIYYRIT